MVKGVATSIITLAVLMGSLVACGGSDNQFSEEEKNDWIIFCSSVAEDGANCARLGQLIEELVSEKGWDKDCLKEELLIWVGYGTEIQREWQNEIINDKCAPEGEEIESTNDDSQSYSLPPSTPFPTSTPQPTPTPRPEPTPTPLPPCDQLCEQIPFLEDLDCDGTDCSDRTFFSFHDFQDAPNRVIENVDFSYSDLRGADFSGLTLRNIRFQFADLYNADFSGATLESVNFEYASAEQTDFSNTTLRMGWFQESNFKSANFTNAIWTDAYNFCGESYKWNPPNTYGAIFSNSEITYRSERGSC